MKTLIKTTDPVLISFIQALLRDAGIEAVVLDQHMSVVEGSLPFLPRRICVDDDDWQTAVDLLKDADVALDNTIL